MRKFLKRKAIAIPIALLLLVALSASAFAAYTFFSGSAEVTVQEAITWSCDGGDGAWDNPTGKWTVSMYPGETKTLNLRFHNASAVDITITPTVAVTVAPPGWAGNVTCGFASATYDVPGHGNCPANLQAFANASASPGLYTCTITITR